MLKKFAAAIGAAAVLSAAGSAYADEGMWTFDNVPVKKIESKYGCRLTQEMLDNIRLSSVRFNDGGSGSFISPTGLVITNHHVASKQLQKMSSPEKDYLKNGFYAPEKKMEEKCADLELNVLFSMEDVTERVQKAAEGLTGGKAIKARKAEIAKIEKESTDKTGLRSDVTMLYGGGQYMLYRYKKYRDVRLVMAPEKQIAFYGGSSDNFTYPRYDLDFAIFRVYENGKPLESKNFLKFSKSAPKENELIFVSGHPGSTRRSITYSQYMFNKEFAYPENMARYGKCLSSLYEYASKTPESRRRAETLIFSYENGKKVTEGEFRGLNDKEFTKKFKEKEISFRKELEKRDDLRKDTEKAYSDIEKALHSYSANYKKFFYGQLAGNRLPAIAMGIVRYCIETQKPDSERKNGYHDSQLERFRFINLSKEPLYEDLEKTLLKARLELSLEKLGENDEAIKLLLKGKTPEARAEELISGSTLFNIAERENLLKGGIEAIKSSKDPLIRLALEMEPMMSEREKWIQSEYESKVTPASEQIAKAKFAIYGKETYPDATFTLRLSYGPVKRYPMNGTEAPSRTTFWGLYDRYFSFKPLGNSGWDIPKIYLDREKYINKNTVLDFVYEADTIGGNSGSPIINAKGEQVGINFDRNTEGLTRQFAYDPKAGRSIAVSTEAVLETLRNIYGAGRLADEIMDYTK